MTTDVVVDVWPRRDDRRGRAFLPLPTDDPALSAACVLCNEPLGASDEGLTLVTLPPTAADDSPTLLVHKQCLDLLTDEQLVAAVRELTNPDPEN